MSIGCITRVVDRCLVIGLCPFSSEREFVEYCNTSFQDAFRVELITDTNLYPLETRAIDDLCATVSPTILRFDKSTAECESSSSNDCKVWSAGWRDASIDISSYAAAEDGKGVTLTFAVTDVGDSTFDSAVLVDDIRITLKP